LIRIALAFVLSTLLTPPALAQADKPNARDSAAIQDCVKTKGGHGWKWEQCIGTISEPCTKDEPSMAPSEVIACYDRELAV